MRKLLLMRHAKSDWTNDGLGDRHRTLNRRGVYDAPRMAKWMIAQGHRPDLVLTSNAVRAVQTWEEQQSLWGSPPWQVEPSLYLAEPDVMLDVLNAAPNDHQTVLLIAHQPGMAGLTKLLSGRMGDPQNARAFQRFSTASIAVLEFDGPDWASLAQGSCLFADYMRPKELEDIA